MDRLTQPTFVIEAREALRWGIWECPHGDGWCDCADDWPFVQEVMADESEAFRMCGGGRMNGIHLAAKDAVEDAE